jgi:hypothetical protein
MSENKILTDLVLSNSTVHALVNAPFDQVDLADWLRKLSDEEYQRCAPGEHKACAHGITDVTDNGDGTCQLSNGILAHPTTDGMAFYTANGITLEQAAAARQEASDAHNHRETPNYAASIARRALASRNK